MKHTYRSQSLPITRSHISDFEIDPDVFLYRDHYNHQIQDSPTPDHTLFADALIGSNVSAHAVGQIPELVDRILSFAYRPVLHNCLFVCKAYNRIATKYLWSILTSAIPLLNLLGPISPTGRAGSHVAGWVSSPFASSPFYALQCHH